MNGTKSFTQDRTFLLKIHNDVAVMSLLPVLDSRHVSFPTASQFISRRHRDLH